MNSSYLHLLCQQGGTNFSKLKSRTGFHKWDTGTDADLELDVTATPGLSTFPPDSPVTTHSYAQSPRGGCQGLRPSLSNVDSDEESGGWTGLCFDRTFGTEVTILARCCFQIFWHIHAFMCVLKHMSSINLNNRSQIYSIYWIHMVNIFLISTYMFTRLSYL